MYLNYTIDYFSELISQVSLSDEKKIIQKIFWFALDLLHKFLDINYFFYEFFNVFDEVNSSYCYLNSKNKPKFGPYGPPVHLIEIIRF